MNSKCGDTLIFGKPLDWFGTGRVKRRADFDPLRVEQLEQVIAQAFVDGNDRENSWIAPHDRVIYARSFAFIGLKCFFEGYVALPLWKQPVAISGIRIEGSLELGSADDPYPKEFQAVTYCK